MIKTKTASKKVAVMSAMLLGAIALGAAFATWTANGSGSGKAQAIQDVDSTVTARVGAADLYPGFDDGDLYFTVDNPNPYGITFTSATFGSITSSVPACAAYVTATNATGLDIDVPGSSLGVDSSIADAISMSTDAVDACQGATFTIGVTLSGTQQ